MRRTSPVTTRLKASVLLALFLLASTLLVASADAQPRGRGADRYARNWQELSPKERERAMENLQRYKSLPESGRQRMDRSYENWQKLDQKERERVQRNYQKYREMTPDQRRDFEKKYKRWKGGKER